MHTLLRQCHRPLAIYNHINNNIKQQKKLQYTIAIMSLSSNTTTNYASNIRNIPTHYNPNTTQQDKLLFTPGPLTTSYNVKQSMLSDYGSRDNKFIDIISNIRSRLLDIANVSPDDYTVIPIQGSGTYGVESVLCSSVDRQEGVLIIVNGAYGERMINICRHHNIQYFVHRVQDNETYDFAAIEKLLNNDAQDVSHIAIIHNETTSGLINDLESIGELATKYKKSYIVDAMSSFGAYDIDFADCGIDYLISSSNKCIESVPGFSYVIARKSKLHNECIDNSSSLSLNLYAQYDGFNKNGQFRFTPPTHTLLAFNTALNELQQEGGIHERAKRYQQNQTIIHNKMNELGFKRYIDDDLQGYIISSYYYSSDKNWSFTAFYNKLNDRGFVIYPGKVSQADCFRIGHIGRIFKEDSERLAQAIDDVCKEMKTAKYAQ